MPRPKKNSYKEFDYDKKFLRLENSHPPTPPPHNFSNGPSLYDYKDMVSLNLIPGAMKDFVKLSTSTIQSTPDNSNLQGKCKKVRVIGSSSYRG